MSKESSLTAEGQQTPIRKKSKGSSQARSDKSSKTATEVIIFHSLDDDALAVIQQDEEEQDMIMF